MITPLSINVAVTKIYSHMVTGAVSTNKALGYTEAAVNNVRKDATGPSAGTAGVLTG